MNCSGSSDDPEILSHRMLPVACRVFHKPLVGMYGEGMFYEVGVCLRAGACVDGSAFWREPRPCNLTLEGT